MDRREMGWGCTEWIRLAQDGDRQCALMSTVMKLWVPKNVAKFLSNRTTPSFRTPWNQGVIIWELKDSVNQIT